MPIIAAIASRTSITIVTVGQTPDLFPVDRSDYEEVVARFDAMTVAEKVAISRQQAAYCGRTRAAIAAKNAGKRERKLEHRAPKRELIAAQVA